MPNQMGGNNNMEGMDGDMMGGNMGMGGMGGGSNTHLTQILTLADCLI